MHPSKGSGSEAQQADLQLIELGAESVEVVEMRRYFCSLIMNSYLHFYFPYNKIVTNYQTVFYQYVTKRVFVRIFWNVKTHGRASLHANRL